MKRITRRDFLKRSQRAALATGLAPALSVGAFKAGDTIGVGLMGAGGRGTQLVEWFAARPDVAVVCIADPDISRAEKCASRVEKITGRKPAVTQDFRRMLDDQERGRPHQRHSRPLARPGDDSRLPGREGRLRREARRATTSGKAAK